MPRTERPPPRRRAVVGSCRIELPSQPGRASPADRPRDWIGPTIPMGASLEPRTVTSALVISAHSAADRRAWRSWWRWHEQRPNDRSVALTGLVPVPWPALGGLRLPAAALAFCWLDNRGTAASLRILPGCRERLRWTRDRARRRPAGSRV